MQCVEVELTEINDDVFVGLDYVLQQLISQLFDSVAIFLFNEPTEYLFLLAQVTWNDEEQLNDRKRRV